MYSDSHTNKMKKETIKRFITKQKEIHLYSYFQI
jgi:hypothetical protein